MVLQFLNGCAHFDNQSLYDKNRLFIQLHTSTSGILSLPKYQSHKTSFLTNQKKTHVVFTTAVAEPLTDFTHKDRSDLASISNGSPWYGRLQDHSGYQQQHQGTSHQQQCLWSATKPAAAETDSQQFSHMSISLDYMCWFSTHFYLDYYLMLYPEQTLSLLQNKQMIKLCKLWRIKILLLISITSYLYFLFCHF